MSNLKLKPKLIILSDLWGREKSCWVDYYIGNLCDKYTIKYYDCCELGEIDKTTYTEQGLHDQFITGGIERAVINLLAKEKEVLSVLAFSIGGTIAWKAGLQGLAIKSLVAVSSTRLRYETVKITGEIVLVFGENDSNKPSDDWFKRMDIRKSIFKDECHELYRKPESAQRICEQILKFKEINSTSPL
jgi:hypothetical protein